MPDLKLIMRLQADDVRKALGEHIGGKRYIVSTIDLENHSWNSDITLIKNRKGNKFIIKTRKPTDEQHWVKSWHVDTQSEVDMIKYIKEQRRKNNLKNATPLPDVNLEEVKAGERFATSTAAKGQIFKKDLYDQMTEDEKNAVALKSMAILSKMPKQSSKKSMIFTKTPAMETLFLKKISAKQKNAGKTNLRQRSAKNP